jgi:hypothetical protein
MLLGAMPTLVVGMFLLSNPHAQDKRGHGTQFEPSHRLPADSEIRLRLN